MLAPVLVNDKLRPHAISVVAYPRVLWTLEQCSRLVGELESIREAELPPAETKAKAWSVMVKATMWAFFRPHTDGHQREAVDDEGFRFYQHMLKVRHELKVRSIAPVIQHLYCIHCSDHASLSSVLVVHEWPSMMIWMRCTRDILCSQPEHLISRQIRARTVRDEPARAWTGAIRIFGSVM